MKDSESKPEQDTAMERRIADLESQLAEANRKLANTSNQDSQAKILEQIERLHTRLDAAEEAKAAAPEPVEEATTPEPVAEPPVTKRRKVTGWV